jgi:hypothetical protein
MIATGLDAGCAHTAALICDEGLSQEAAGQLSATRMMTASRRPWCRTVLTDSAI